MGAWIETKNWTRSFSGQTVASYMGAWIETLQLPFLIGR